MIIEDGMILQIVSDSSEFGDSWESFEKRHEFTGKWLVNRIEGDLYGRTYFEVRKKVKILFLIPSSYTRWASADSFRFIEITQGDCKG